MSNVNLNAPCIFCGYNGPDYWQKGSHLKDCPFYYFGGKSERSGQLHNIIRKKYTDYQRLEEEYNELLKIVEAKALAIALK